MTNKILVITAPDDVLEQGKRISAVDLTATQSFELAESIKQLDDDETIVVYKWTCGDKIDWLLDKIYKSDAILFNAESNDQTLVGFLAAQRNSCYFGALRSIKEVNKSVVYTSAQCTTFLNYKFNL